MTPFCPYCGIPTTLLQEPIMLGSLHLLTKEAYYWKCKPCNMGMAYTQNALYVTFSMVNIGARQYVVQLRSHLPPIAWVYSTFGNGAGSVEEIHFPEQLANQLTPQNIEAKLRTFLTFS